MCRTNLCFALIVCLIPAHVLSAFVAVSEVGFDQHVAKYTKALVLFHVMNDMDSTNLVSAFTKVADYPPEKTLSCSFLKVVCGPLNGGSCNTYGVGDKTALKLFDAGTFDKDYEGPADVDGVLRFVQTRRAIYLENRVELDEFLRKEEDPAVVGFLQPDSGLTSVFLQVADDLGERYRFAFSYAILLPSGKEAAVLHRPEHLSNALEETNVTCPGATAAELTDFVKTNYFGLVGHRTTTNSHMFEAPRVIIYYDIDYDVNPKVTRYWRNRILLVAKAFADKFTFAMSSRKLFAEELVEAGLDLDEDDREIFVVAEKSKDQICLMNATFSPAEFKTFLEDVLSGKVEARERKSKYGSYEDEEEEEGESHIKVVSKENFAEAVTENDKDTFIMFHAPWCGHCRSLVPTIRKLADRLKDEDVVIAKMDATKGDAPAPFAVDGFPTLYWASKNSKDKPEVYDGDRTLRGLTAFIASKATEPLKAFGLNGKRKKVKDEL